MKMQSQTLKNLCSFALLAAGLLSCQPSSTFDEKILETGVSSELAKFRKDNLKDLRYRLFFNIPESRSESLKGKAEITCLTEDPRAFILDFKVQDEQIDSVCLNGKKVDFRFQNEHIQLSKITQGEENTVTVYFTCSDQSLNRREDFLYTLLVPDRARTLFPCFDQPNLKGLYELSLEIPSKWEAVANAKDVSAKEYDNNTRTLINFQQTDPISTYLFSFVAGKLNKETFQRDNRSISIYHRENDPQKTAQCNDIATEVFDALKWMEDYTQIPYPFAKYDLVIVPGFQFGGMEHIGATLYTDSRMFLNAQPTLRDRLIRSSLIAHETAHMWFGDYVTMKWFDDVWTKEVFANYFASLITEPRYPKVNHQLNFITDYLPGAYSEDRTLGSNPIKQELDNLERAGLVYGNIIYNKSPWVMNSLAERMGKDAFRTGMQQYLRTYANANATWDDLISILDKLTTEDLKSWSHSWVNEKGRPTIEAHIDGTDLVVSQTDKWGRGVIWPQNLNYIVCSKNGEKTVSANFIENETKLCIPLNISESDLNNAVILPNTDGKGYGLFLINENKEENVWQFIRKHNGNSPKEEVLRGSLLISLYENLRNGSIDADSFQKHILEYLPNESNPLLYSLGLGYLSNCQSWYETVSEPVEEVLWLLTNKHPNPGYRIQALRYYISLAKSSAAIDNLFRIWDKQVLPGNCKLSEKDYMKLAYVLALRLPDKATDIIKTQADRISHPDRQREFDFISAAVSPSGEKRDSVFNSLLEKENRNIEPWASDALALLNHPIYQTKAVKYIRPALEEMQEIQRTGDIFFPRAWARALLSGHNSHEAAEEVRRFFADHPDYPIMLANKIKQQAEHLENK